MQNIAFDKDLFPRRVTRYLILLEIGVMLLVLTLIAFHFYSWAMRISLLMLLVFISIFAWLYLRFQQLPVVKEKHNLLQRNFQLQKSIYQERNTIQALKQKREDIFQAEQNEFDNVLRDLQKKYIQKGLSSRCIEDAVIPGVGPKRKELLAKSGIITAADISDSKIAQIHGFGDARRLAIRSWQSAIFTELDRNKPTKLPDEQLKNIQQKYQALQDQNDTNLQKAEKNQQKSEENLILLQPRLKQLAFVTFTAYLGKSLASKRYIALFNALVLIITQAVSGLSATTSAIVASIPTATASPTITLTPTATFTPTITDTPTVTFTPTVTDTQTITFTPTFTSTPTVTFTPLPTQTRRPTKTLVPIVTVRVPESNLSGNNLQNVPAGVTAICNDGTYSYSQHRRGTCSHHGGVKQWINRPPN